MGYTFEKRTVSREDSVIVGATCDNCYAPLECYGTGENSGDWKSCSPSKALNITIYGGYGMWSDEEDASIVLCADCIDKLWRAFPAFQKALKVEEEQPTKESPAFGTRIREGIDILKDWNNNPDE